MQHFFSPSTGGFYSDVIHGPRKLPQPQTEQEIEAGKRPRMAPNPGCAIPADAVEVSEEAYAALMEAQAAGAAIITRNGGPAAGERVPDPAELEAARRRQRDRLLAESDWTQLPDSPLSAEQRLAWAAYRQALRDLDMAGIDWPVIPAGDAA